MQFCSFEKRGGKECIPQENRLLLQNMPWNFRNKLNCFWEAFHFGFACFQQTQKDVKVIGGKNTRNCSGNFLFNPGKIIEFCRHVGTMRTWHLGCAEKSVVCESSKPGGASGRGMTAKFSIGLDVVWWLLPVLRSGAPRQREREKCLLVHHAGSIIRIFYSGISQMQNWF